MDSDTGEELQAPVEAADDAASLMRKGRKKAGLSLTDVATRTRVPLRHLEALERGDYGALPGITYCAGFARAFARAVDMDEVSLVAKIRKEVDDAGDFASTQFQIDEPLDPARIPPRIMAWIAAVIALLIVGGYALWRIQLNAPPAEDEAAQSLPPPPVAAPASAPPPAAVTTGPVILSATDDVWLRIYDDDHKVLFEGMLKRGDAFTVPMDAKNPMILTGRPDALAVTVGGSPVPPLGDGQKTITDFPISAAALLARGTAQPAVPAAGAPAAVRPTAEAVPPVQPPVRAPASASPALRPGTTAPATSPAQPGNKAVPPAKPVARPLQPSATASPAKPAAQPVPAPTPAAASVAPASPPAEAATPVE